MLIIPYSVILDFSVTVGETIRLLLRNIHKLVHLTYNLKQVFAYIQNIQFLYAYTYRYIDLYQYTHVYIDV